MKKPMCIRIDEKIQEKIKDIVYWTPGLSVSGLAEELFMNYANKLEKKRGIAFEKRKK